MALELGFLLLGFLGFAAYEVGIRIIDNETDWIKRIGYLRYTLYVAIFGGATAIVAGGFASTFIPGAALAEAFAVLFGMGMPSTLRVFAEVVTKLVYKKAESTVGGDRTEGQKSEPVPGEKDEVVRMEEARLAKAAYKPQAYRIGDFFGFSSRLDGK